MKKAVVLLLVALLARSAVTQVRARGGKSSVWEPEHTHTHHRVSPFLPPPAETNNLPTPTTIKIDRRCRYPIKRTFGRSDRSLPRPPKATRPPQRRTALARRSSSTLRHCCCSDGVAAARLLFRHHHQKQQQQQQAQQHHQAQQRCQHKKQRGQGLQALLLPPRTQRTDLSDLRLQALWELQ